MDPDQTARMRRLVWIHVGRKRITLVLSWRGSNVNKVVFNNHQNCTKWQKTPEAKKVSGNCAN
jgi:hypothetical protein